MRAGLLLFLKSSIRPSPLMALSFSYSVVRARAWGALLCFYDFRAGVAIRDRQAHTRISQRHGLIDAPCFQVWRRPRASWPDLARRGSSGVFWVFSPF